MKGTARPHLPFENGLILEHRKARETGTGKIQRRDPLGQNVPPGSAF